MTITRTITTIPAIALGALLLSACGDNGSMEETGAQVGAKMDETAAETREVLDEAAERTGDAIEAAGDKIESATD